MVRRHTVRPPPASPSKWTSDTLLYFRIRLTPLTREEFFYEGQEFNDQISDTLPAGFLEYDNFIMARNMHAPIETRNLLRQLDRASPEFHVSTFTLSLLLSKKGKSD